LAGHSSRSVCLVFLLSSALLVSISSLVVPSAHAAALTVTPLSASGKSGDVILVDVTGGSAFTTATTCTLTSSTNVVASYSLTRVPGSSPGEAHGSFTVGTAPGPSGGGAYTLTVTCTTGTTVDSGTASFTIQPKITILPPIGQSSQVISVTGVGFRSDYSTCVISGAPVVGTPWSCSLTGGSMSGSFTVDPAAATSTYTITVSAPTVPAGDQAATALFQKVANPTIAVYPPSAPPGYGTLDGTVTVTGGVFASGSARSCSLTGAAGLFAASPVPTCSISTTGTVTGSFAVAQGVPPATYTNGVRVTDTNPLGVYDEADFTVLNAPTLNAASPTSGAAGATVTLSTATSFAIQDVGPCTITSYPSGLTSFYACYINSAGGFAIASFIISGSAAGGAYVVIVTGLHGDSATTSFTVTNAVTLSPDHGPQGTAVTVTGSGFSGSDTFCRIYWGMPVTTPDGSGGFITGSSCAILGGAITGSFNVPSDSYAGPGTHQVVVFGFPSAGFGIANFVVRPGIALSPSAGRPGATVVVIGSNFALGDTGACTISSSPSGLISGPVCTIASGTMSGTFVVASGTSGAYTVTVTGITADSGSATFNVPPPPTLILTPNTGTVATLVTASGLGYLGITCLLTAVPAGLFSSSACSIAAGTLSGSFAVAPGALSGSYTVTVQTSAGAGDSATAVFTVGPIITPTTTVTSSTILTTGSVTTTATVTTPLTTTSVTATSVVTTTGPWTPPKPCIIATVTFGSEVSSAVQFLRSFRDGLVLSTKAGSAFMEVFNAWYYSFSPSVAGFIAGNDPLRAPVRVLLYPLLGILGISTLAYSLLSGVPEFAIVVAGLAASSLIGLVYMTLPAMLGMRVFLKRRRVRLVGVAKGSVALLTIALALLAVGEVTGSFLLLAVGGSAIVLTCLIAAPAIFALAMLHPNPE